MAQTTVREEQLRVKSITVMDIDGDPSISNVDKIIFSGQQVTNLGNGDVLVSVSGFGSNSFVYNEIPSGLVNGSNREFVFSGGFMENTLQLYRDGQLMRPGGNDYTVSNPITGEVAFVTAPPASGVVMGSFQRSVSTTGNADTLDGYHASSFISTSQRSVNIQGLNLSWLSNSGILIGIGACIAENGDYITLTGGDVKSGLSLSPSTVYHVYAYLSGGAGTTEIVTTAPTLWKGTAYRKTGDTSRRYLGSIATDTSGNVLNFIQIGNKILYREDINAAANNLLVVSNGLATSFTSVSCSNVIPVTSRAAMLQVSHSSTAGGYMELRTSDSDVPATGTVGMWVASAAAGATDLYGWIALNTTQAFEYRFTVTPNPYGIYAFVQGYEYDR